MDDLSGKVIKGYELQKRIGAGGFGAVYRAYQPLVKREVAIKVILPEFASQPEFIRRFEAEAQLVARLEHLNIVPLYDYWRDPEGAFLVMRWLRGGSLRDLLAHGSLTLEQIAHILDQIAAALAVAHRSGVIHRDMKPDNILLDEERNAYLADFGIAKDIFQPTSNLDEDGDEPDTVTGSPSYMSPEQIMGQTLSPQTDIYSLGVVLYELVVGKPPFEAPAPSMLIMKHLTELPPSAHVERDDLPSEVSDVIHTAMAKKPEERYPNTLAMARDFRLAIFGKTAESAAAPIDPYATIPITEKFLGYDGLAPENPYKGLRAFQEADEDDFFGRETLVERLLNKIKDSRFMAVVGPSGSGKSSLVRAGILPTLRRGRLEGSDTWFVVEMMPGAQVYDELAAALLKVAVKPPENLVGLLRRDGLASVLDKILPTDSELLLFIDQFEEVFTQNADEASRSAFLNTVLEAVRVTNSRLRVIVTLRADFYDRPLLYPDFGELVREASEIVLPMNSNELERAITFPAENAELGLEMGLVTAIVTDVSEQAGALPLLQFALTELFERRDGRWLTLQAYRDIGGVSGALAQRADSLYETLDEAGKRAAQQVFLRLVTLGEGAEDTRRRIQQAELLSLKDSDTIQQVVDLFVKYRLLTLDRDPSTRAPTVEVAHEALIRRWTLLRGWLNESRESLLVSRRLTTATEEWLNTHKDKSYLASGSRLAQFEAEKDKDKFSMTTAESEYLEASLKQRDELLKQEQAEQAYKAKIEKNSRDRLRALVAVMSVAAIISVGLSVFAFNQSRVATENAATATNAQGQAIVEANNAATAQGEALVQADVAATAAAESLSLALASGAQLALARDDTDLAIALGVEANTSSDAPPQALRTLADVVFSPGTQRVLAGHTDWVRDAAFSPDGRTAVTASSDRTLILWDLATGEIIQRFGGDSDGHSDWVWAVAFSPDGETIISGSSDRTLILWDVATGEVIRRYGANGDGHQDVVSSVAFTPDGMQIVSGSWDKTLILWDVATGDIIQRFGTVDGASGGHTNKVNAVAVASGGLAIFSVSEDGTMIVWNASSGQPILRFDDADTGIGHNGVILDVAVLPDSSGAITAGSDSNLIRWSLETGNIVRVYTGGHTGRVFGVSLSADGRTMLSVSEDRSAILWDVETGAVLQRFTGHSGQVLTATFSPDRQHFLTTSSDQTARLWDLTSGAQTNVFRLHDFTVYALALSPDQHTVISGSLDNVLRVWDLRSGEILRELVGHERGITDAAISPDGEKLVSSSLDGAVIFWELESGEEIRRFEGHDEGQTVWSMAFTPDGTRLLTGSSDNTLILWDVQTGEIIYRMTGHTASVQSVAISPDGTQAASSSIDKNIILWDLQSGSAIRTLTGHTDWALSVAFSPDGERLISSSTDNTLILWDVSSGEIVRRFEGHDSEVGVVIFSPDGRYVLSGSRDKFIILWDVETGDEIQRFTGHTAAVWSLVFDEDGSSFISGATDGTVRAWQVITTQEGLLTWMRENRYARELTCVERDQYGLPFDNRCLTPTPTPDPASESA